MEKKLKYLGTKNFDWPKISKTVEKCVELKHKFDIKTSGSRTMVTCQECSYYYEIDHS
jgi:hypothetical protein